MKKDWRPRKCQIGALTYKIKYVQPGVGKKNLLKPNENGCILQQEQTICIDKNLSPQITLLVLIHEILHGIGDCIHPEKSPFTKESFTATVAELLLQALQSSKLLSS